MMMMVDKTDRNYIRTVFIIMLFLGTIIALFIYGALIDYDVTTINIEFENGQVKSMFYKYCDDLAVTVSGYDSIDTQSQTWKDMPPDVREMALTEWKRLDCENPNNTKNWLSP